MKCKTKNDISDLMTFDKSQELHKSGWEVCDIVLYVALSYIEYCKSFRVDNNQDEKLFNSFFTVDKTLDLAF